MSDLRVFEVALAVILTSGLVGFALADPFPAEAWEGPAHTMITSQALSVLPEPLRRALKQYRDELASGVLEPDNNRIESHKIHLHAIRNKKVKSGGAQFALERFAEQAESIIKTGESMDKVAFVLGQAAHFAQDLNVPLHTITGETDAEHRSYERQAYFTDWPGQGLGYSGFLLVKKYKCFAHETAKRSNRFVDAALSPVPPRDVIESTWNDAVNDTANLWQSIFYRALGPEKSRELYAIPEPKSEIGRGWIC